MAITVPQVADRVVETSTTTGTGTLTLSGPLTGYQAFSSVFSVATIIYYCISNNATDWEVGIGTYTPGGSPTLARTTVLASSNAGALVNFTTGSKNVFSTQPALAFQVPRAAGIDGVFWENGDTVTHNYTITTGANAHSVGPITINTGVTVTIPTGQRWVIS